MSTVAVTAISVGTIEFVDTGPAIARFIRSGIENRAIRRRELLAR
jgi:hypothetical protein